MDDCCRRFAAYHDRPDRMPAPHAVLDLDDVGRARDDDARVTVTARSLMLTRTVTVQASPEERYDFDEERFRLPRWHHDTYYGGLGLAPDVLSRWEGERVLDLAAGLAMFPTEAASLGITVDCADLEFDDEHPHFGPAARVVSQGYPLQMDLLRCLSTHSDNATYDMDDATERLLERLHADRDAIAARYPAPGGRRFRADARRLDEVADATYRGVVCGWLLCHLDEDDERRVVEAMVRVCAAGGEVRIKAGIGGSLLEPARAWFGAEPDATELDVGGRRARVDPVSHGDLLVLHVQ